MTSVVAPLAASDAVLSDEVAARRREDVGVPRRAARAGAPAHVAVAAVLTGVTSGATVMLARSGAPGAATTLYPVLVIVIAAWLLRRHPERYASFVWWTWFVAPWVRRVIDVYGGWNPVSLLSIAPLLVSGLAVIPVLRRAPRLRRRALAPFTLAALGVGLGFLVGVARVGLMAATYGLLSWGTPLAFGAWLTLEWRRYVPLRDVVLHTLTAGLVVVALYGMYQFVSPPVWDRNWMISSAMESIGRPEPFQVRVFSTMNSPGTLAAVLCASLLLVSTARVVGRLIAVSIASITLLLTLGRAAWIGLLVGAAVLALQMSRVTLLRYGTSVTRIVVGAVIAVCLVSTALPSDMTARAADVVSRRVRSTLALDQDASFFDRREKLRQALEWVEAEPLGYGIGASGGGVLRLGVAGAVEPFDNGLLEVIYALGWPGATLLYGAIIWIGAPGLQRRAMRGDAAPLAARAVLAAAAVELLAGNQFTSAIGAAFWSAAGLLSAARVWYALPIVVPDRSRATHHARPSSEALA